MHCNLEIISENYKLIRNLRKEMKLLEILILTKKFFN